MNRIFLMGRLTRDPEVRYSQSANPMPVARFGIAVNKTKSRSDGIKTDFFNIVAFDRLATFSEKYLKKGTKVMVSGKVNTGYYDRNGINTPFFEVAADDIEFAESRASGNNFTVTGAGNAESVNNAENVNNTGSTKGTDAAADVAGFIQVDDNDMDELPFLYR